MDDPGRIEGRYGSGYTPDGPDHVIAALAEAQYGVVSRRQLEELGLGGGVRRRLAGGRLHVIHHGVYAVGHRRLARSGIWMAAVLACGPGAVLSHADAGALWALRPSARRLIDVSVPTRTRARRPGIAIHRPRGLGPEDVTTHDAIPCTSVARTLLDLATILPAHALARVCEQAEILRVLDMREVDALIARQPRRPGVPALRHALAHHAETGMTRSDLEARFRNLCLAAHLPLPAVNDFVELPKHPQPVEVDAIWRDRRLIVEVDGWETHGTRTAFERDRARDADLQEAGWRVLRTTHRQLKHRPHEIAARLARMLGA